MKVKNPLSSVVYVRVMARSALKIVTRAPLTACPDESRTVPLIDAVIWDCPSADCPQTRKAKSADNNKPSLRDLLARAMHTPLPDISAERPRLHLHYEDSNSQEIRHEGNGRRESLNGQN